MTEKSAVRTLLDRALADYEPRTISPKQWSRIRSEVEELLVAAAPSSEADARALVANLLAFLADGCRDQDLSLGNLTADKAEDFVRRRQAAGAPASTLQQIRPRLRRLVRAHDDQAPWKPRVAARSRVSIFDPHSDDEVQLIRALKLPAEQQRAVDCALALAERLGLPRQDVGRARKHGQDVLIGDRRVAQLEEDDPLLAGVADGEAFLQGNAWVAARKTIENRTGISLLLNRLRHRFLARIGLQQGIGVAQMMLEHGLGRDDLDVLLGVASVGDPDISDAQCVEYLTRPVRD